ncbi:type III-A CRISPR-associated protein Csm2 [Megasphaera massiliensis]|uniref:type III-A CRISPR-associated protein Csm2 n=2 Tax=Megasphaera TaxID=906 RepID=UPI0039995F2E
MMRDVGKEAEKVISNLKEQKGFLRLKTNQIRKFLSAVNTMTNRVNAYKASHIQATDMPDELAGEIRFLKVKAAYQSGRDRTVEEFMKACKMEDWIDGIGTSIKKFEEFSRYMEALVAYHKYYGGKD